MASPGAGVASTAAALMPPPPAPSSEVLRGVVALVLVRSETEGLNASACFARRLTSLGAVVAERLSKSVTHVVFKGDDDALRQLHDRITAERLSPRPAVLGVAWVAACATGNSRAAEKDFAVARPKDTLASLVSPLARSASAGARQPRSMAPLPAQRYGARPRALSRTPCARAGCRAQRLRSARRSFAFFCVFVASGFRLVRVLNAPLRAQSWTWRTRCSRRRSAWPPC